MGQNMDVLLLEELLDLRAEVAKYRRLDAAHGIPGGGSHESFRRLRAVFEHALDGFILVDSDGRVIDANPAACRLSGYTRDELQRLMALDLLADGHLPSRRADWEAFKQSEGRRGEMVLLAKGNANVPTEYNAVPSIAPGVHLIAFRDIAEKARYRSVIAAMGEGVCIFDSSGAVIAANPAAERIFNRGNDNLCRHCAESPVKAVHEDGSPFPRDAFPVAKTLRTGEPQVNQVMGIYRSTDGELIWTSINTQPLRAIGNGALLGVVATFHDITERKRAIDALRVSEERLRLILEATSEGIWDWDVASQTLYWSDRVFDLLGYAVGELKPTSDLIAALIHPQDVSGFYQAVFKHLEGRGPLSVELRMRDKRGDYLWMLARGRAILDDKGNTVRVLGTLADISLRKAAEQRFKDSERRLADAQRAAAIGHWEADLIERRVVWSPALFEISGLLPSDEPLPMATVRSVVHPEDLPALDRVMQECTSDGKSHICRLRIVRPDGEVRYTVSHGRAHFDEKGSPVAVVGTMQDITPLALAERALHETNVQLEQRIEERTRELSRANDELRREIEERRTIEEALRREQKMLEDLLAAHERDRQFTAYEIHDGFVQEAVSAKMHLEAFQRRLLSVPNAPASELESSIKLLGHAVAEGRRLITGLRPPIIDEAGIVAALEYLVREHHVPGVFEIELTHRTAFDRLSPILEGSMYRIVQEALTNAARHSQSDRAAVRLTQVDRRLRIEIRDWGTGFDADRVPEHRYGLQGIRERARLLRGCAVISSEPGQGTCIVVDLPLVPAASNSTLDDGEA